MLRRLKPLFSSSAGTHAGMSPHALTLCSLSTVTGTQCSRAPPVVAAFTPSSISCIVIRCAGPVALNTPIVRCSATRIVHSARSRASMICTGSLPSPGASTSPPLASLTGQ